MSGVWDDLAPVQSHCSPALPPFIIPVTLVPRPAFSAGPGSEVGAAQVHDAGGEAQQAAVSVRPVHPGSGGRQAVLLIGTAQQVEGSVLQVGRLLDKLGVQYEVRSRCGRVKGQCLHDSHC